MSCGNEQTSQTDIVEKTSSSENETSSKSDETKANSDKMDVDLTQLSSIMVYAEVYNMMSAPEEYIGKNVKMSGAFAIYQDEDTKKLYFACIIADATACCSQGLEFVLEDERSYPDDYPEIDSEIIVTGIFDVYEEDGYEYCQLINAKLVD